MSNEMVAPSRANKLCDLLAGEGFDVPINLDATFEAMGADSLDVVNLIMAVEEDFGVEIPDLAIADFKTPRDVVAWLDAHQPS